MDDDTSAPPAPGYPSRQTQKPPLRCPIPPPSHFCVGSGSIRAVRAVSRFSTSLLFRCFLFLFFVLLALEAGIPHLARPFPILLPKNPNPKLRKPIAEITAMEIAANERALEAGGEPRHQLGFRLRLPRLRDPRLSTAAAVAAWGVAGILSTTVPDLVANRDHVLLYFIFLMAAVLLLLLAVAAPDLNVAERVAGRLEGWLRTMLFRGA